MTVEGQGVAKSGFRLSRFEIYNWGTFRDRVWSLDLGGENTLLTGDIGSGKSTLVDALTTLLLPANRISYNKAAGAEIRERSLRSYVLGYYKSERVEETGTTRPVGLRGTDSFSVILGVFGNEGYDLEVSLAQVFYWSRDRSTGQPDRYYVVADRAMAIAKDFADFGTEIAGLRKQLRASGCRIYDAFPQYGRDFRRQLRIASEQAMELFHQTVSMKSVGSLNEFVREHMLEPFDAQRSIEGLVAHFDDLTKAHDAVVKARQQLELLEPILTDCDTYDRLVEEIAGLDLERLAVPYFCADRKAGALRDLIEQLRARRTGLQGEQSTCVTKIGTLRDRLRDLEIERAGHGGNRLTEIERDIARLETQRSDRRKKWDQFNALLRGVELPEIEQTEQFPHRRAAVEQRDSEIRTALTDAQTELQKLAIEHKRLDDESRELRVELSSLQSRTSNIPAGQIAVRRRLCEQLDIAEDELPFAGELIQVRSDWSDWEGAAERVLHGFALSMLVPEAHYQAVSGWINTQHLGARLIYYRVPRDVVPHTEPAIGERQLFDRLEIKDCAFTAWLERELVRRAGYLCADTMDEFRRATHAVTRQGQVKGGVRHEKDDRRRIDDRSWYVLGWDNRQKIETLLATAGRLQNALNTVRDDRKRHETRQQSLQDRSRDLASLLMFDTVTELDWQWSVAQIAELGEERRRIEAASSKLAALGKQIEATKDQIETLEARNNDLTGAIGGLNTNIERAETQHRAALAKLDEPGATQAHDLFERLADQIDQPPGDPDGWDRIQLDLDKAIGTAAANRRPRQTAAANRAGGLMAAFKQRYPLETADMDNTIGSAAEYRRLRQRLITDDLPRFEAQFKEYLNKNTINDIATFQAQLNRQVNVIGERLATINESLLAIEYNDGRYIRLERQPTPNEEIRRFRADMRACTDSSMSGDDSEQYSEQKFLQVKAIVDRFRGREGFTDIDRTWRRQVADVRNWFVFAASERWREDDTEHESYAGSGGKSGGQKEKLAYTILAASLAYQFKLDWSATRSTTFHFAVIDEAFGRGSEKSTDYALQLFRRLGLQLLIVTPLQKIHVIEPYVCAVGFVDNTAEGDYSRLQNLTIEEYRERRAIHQGGTRQ